MAEKVMDPEGSASDSDEELDLTECAELIEHDRGRIKFEMEACFGNEESDLGKRRINCSKNPGHPRFIPVDKFTKDDLPVAWNHPFVWQCATVLAHNTVRIVIKGASPARPQGYPFSGKQWRKATRYGSGYVNLNCFNSKDVFPCTMRNCSLGEEHKEYGKIYVSTASHVVFDDIEAENTTIEFFFHDINDKTGVQRARVLSAGYDILTEDRTLLQCVTHDLSLITKLRQIGKDFDMHRDNWRKLDLTEKDASMNQYGLVVSHPHGMAKHISIGKLNEETVKTEQGVPCYDASTCPGSSGAPVLHFATVHERFPMEPAIFTHSRAGDSGYNEGSVLVYFEGTGGTFVR